MKLSFQSHGKLLLSGEYVVLDGALSLAVPTTYSQYMEVTTTTSGLLVWQSLDQYNSIWFKTQWNLNQLKGSADSSKTSTRLLQIFEAARELNPEFLKNATGFTVQSKIDFPLNWGLGSSSTLINNIANWAQVDPYKLLAHTFGGSGYDIACARSTGPILYKLENKLPKVKQISFDPVYKSKLFFVYLNKKQDSREGISLYKKQVVEKEQLVSKISQITQKMISCTDLKEFEALLGNHELIISDALGMPTVKEELFRDYQGAIKSLGAWGGDFILATGGDKTSDYFKDKGYNVVIPFAKMVVTD